MKTNCKKTKTLGDLITSAYDACGHRKGRAIVRFAFDARIVMFQGRLHDAISRTNNNFASLDKP